jgi:tetratricopeptide (TPR) repeat protein
MSARSVSIRLGCLLFGAALAINAQFGANDPRYRRYGVVAGVPLNPIDVDGTVPDASTQTQDPVGPGGTISIKRLNHKVPGKAAKEYEKGTHLRDKHKFEQALSHFQKALEIDPEFVEAANDIGATYADLKRVADAQAAFEKTIKIDPQYWSGYFNLAVMYMVRGEFADGERAARRATDLNRSNAGNRLILGMALVLENKFTDEAIGLLENTRDEYPQAHLFLARALAGRGRNETARTEIRNFLGCPLAQDAEAKELAESWLQALAGRK